MDRTVNGHAHPQSLTARLSPYLVAPLLVLIAALLVLRCAGALGFTPLADWQTAARYALAIMFAFTAAAHFGHQKESLVRMVPSWMPSPRRVIAITGVLELLGALGLLLTLTAPLAGICLAVLLVAMFPANVKAAARLSALRDWEFVEQLAQQVLSRPRDGVRQNDLGTCLLLASWRLLGRGDLSRAEAAWRELSELAARTGDAVLRLAALQNPMLLEYLRGDLEGALQACDESAVLAAELGVHGWSLTPEYLYIHLGRADEALRAPQGSTNQRIQLAWRALLLAHLGRHSEARAIRDQFGDIGSDQDETASHILVHLLEAAILEADSATVTALSRRLAPFADRLAYGGMGFGFGSSIARILGDASVLLNRFEEARGHYAQALEVCARASFRPEIAITRLQLGALLLEHYPEQRTLAIEHLTFVAQEFESMHMVPWLERAQHHLGQLPVARIHDDPFTAREREVAALVALGKSNREIAEALVISDGTAEVHVKHILGKLGFKSRSQIAAWAAERAVTPARRHQPGEPDTSGPDAPTPDPRTGSRRSS